MTSDTEQLLRRIRLGEDSTLELERVVVAGNRVSDPSRDAMSDELAAFANSRATSGVVLLGIDDKSREVLGIPLEHLDVVETWLRQICNDSIDPPLAASIRKLELVVSLLARCPMPGGDAVGRPFLMDRRGDGVPIIQEETLRLAGRVAEYTLIDDSELRLILPSATLDTITPLEAS